MTRYSLIGFVLLLQVAGIARGADYSLSVVAENLEFPSSLAFLPNGEMLVTERVGRLRMVRNDELVSYDVRGVPEVFAKGQGGLLDVVVDPGFHDNETIYLSYSSGSALDNSLRVSKGWLDGSTLQDPKVILDVTPRKNTPHHFGGRMAFLADGSLLITSGDGFDYREQAQQLDSMLGKLLRIQVDGSIPADNPFVGVEGAAPAVFTYGHRNPQGIVVAGDGRIWLHEHGPKGGDELNRIVAGKNYGWPAVTFGLDYSGAVISPFTRAEGMEAPVAHWTPSIAPAGMTEYRVSLFPEWRGNLFVAALAEKSVRRLVLEGDTVAHQELMFQELEMRIRDVREGPDGALYLLTDANPGTVYRVMPAER